MMAQGIPSIVLGSAGEEDTEASSKISYLSFEQLIKFRQQLWEENIKNQLGINIKFKFPASIAPELINDNKKDGPKQTPDKINPTKQTQ